MDEIESFVEQSAPSGQPTVHDDLPYKVSLTKSGVAVVIESPFGGYRPEWPQLRTEIVINHKDWPAIVRAVEANFAEAERLATDRNALDRMMGEED